MARQPAHWAWGVAGGAALGFWYGDSWKETTAGALLGSPWGSTALAYSTQGVYRGAAWSLGTRAGLAARGIGLAGLSFAASATAAVVGPALVGYGVSHLIAGDQGRDDYVDFLSGRVSPSDWWDAVTLQSMR